MIAGSAVPQRGWWHDLDAVSAFLCCAHVPIFLLIMVAGCTPSADARQWSLVPLTVRPEDPDTTNIQDQNDFMPSTSPNGELVLFASRRSGTERLYLMNTDGSDERVISSGPGTQMQGSWSPDGKKIVYLHSDQGNRYLASMNADGSDPEMLTEAPRTWPTPFWSPDGERILYHKAGQFGADDIWSIDRDGGEPELVLGSSSDDWHPAWSPDGTRIVFVSRRDGDDFEVYVTDLNGGPWIQLTDNEVDDYTPIWSPDGTQIVFQTPRGGRWTIVTINADGSAQTPITQYPMQWDPVWSHDGSEIFFNSARDGRRGIYVMNADGSNQRKLTNTEPGAFVTVVREAGVDEAARLFREARAENPEAVYFYEREVQYLGENYLEMGHLRQAALLFEVNVEAYPESKATHMDLGKTRLAAGEIGLAVESYQRALELDPEDGQIAGLLERLRKEMGAGG